MKPYIASVVRNNLQVLVGVLLAYGVSESEAHEWVKASEPIVTGLALYVIAQAWSFANVKTVTKIKAWAKRYGMSIL